MSIVACVKVYDGIVLGAESMTQLWANIGGQAQFIKSYSNARKLFRIGDLPVGVLTYGAGNIGNRSIESFVDDFGKQFRPSGNTTTLIEEVSRELLNCVRGPYETAFTQVPVAQRPPLGFYIAGYSAGQHLGSEFEFMLPAATQPTSARPVDQVGASWRGIAAPFSRLFFGVDPRVDELLRTAGVSPDIIQRFRELVTTSLVTKVAFDGMPIQDAIGFCRFILEATIGSATYELGMPSCGGPIHIAVITRAGFRWVAEPVLR
jgi:hypothetical protein